MDGQTDGQTDGSVDDQQSKFMYAWHLQLAKGLTLIYIIIIHDIDTGKI